MRSIYLQVSNMNTARTWHSSEMDYVWRLTHHFPLVVVIMASQNEVYLGDLPGQTTVVMPPHVSHCHH